MTKPLPSLALAMSQDGIALHQLAFDGHWHELARVALNDPALRERLSNMRSIASKLEGRRFKARIWLPEDQIFRASINLPVGDDSTRPTKARAEIAAKFGGKPADYSVQVGARKEGGAYTVAAVRVRTMQEAKTFAKSHGFRAQGYSTQAAIEGFAQTPNFTVPADKVKIAGLGLVAATAATLVFGGGYAFYTVDPLNLWETPPLTADFAPFQQPNPGIERAGAPPVPGAGIGAPAFPQFAAISSAATPAPLPYLPPRQLTAEAQEQIDAPAAPAIGTPPAALQLASATPVNWPAAIASLPAPAAPDESPSIGLINLLDRIPEPLPPEADTAPPPPSGPMLAYNASPRPITVANTPFFLEPLPAMATRLSPDALAQFAARSGLSIAQLSRMAPPLLLAESKLVEVTPGLPPIMPRLRSGRAIPAQGAAPVVAPISAPPVATPPSGPAPLFTLVSGAPDIRPRFRPAPDAPLDTATPIAAETTAPAQPGSTTDDNATLAAAVDAAIVSALVPEAPALFALVQGQPALLPRLRSGNEIPQITLASAAPTNLDPATLEANTLRPRRRPQAVAEIAAPISDPMISGAAPVTATRPQRRNAAFAANSARIVEQNASRPRVTTPTVPSDPQTVSLPTSASVARAATIENAINLRKTNLLGIYGSADNRTALIMLSGGRMVRVQLGDTFSGWTVVAISANTVRIRKRKREEILRMPAE